MRTSDKPAFQDSSSWKLPGVVRIADGDDGLHQRVICYSFASSRSRSDASGALDDFIDIRNTSEKRILHFAKRWGVLHLQPQLREDIPNKPEWREPLDFYETLPRSFNAAREIHAYINEGQRAPSGLWSDLYAWPLLNVPGLGGTVLAPHDSLLNHLDEEFVTKAWLRVLLDGPYWPRQYDARFLADQVNTWLNESDVRPALLAQQGNRFGAIEFNVKTLYGALVVQLLKELSGLSGWVLCSNPKCRRSYAPGRRRPKAGQRHFCPTCRNSGIPQQFALRDYRRRHGMSTIKTPH